MSQETVVWQSSQGDILEHLGDFSDTLLRKERDKMRDEDKTREQLIDELIEARRQIAELRGSQHIQKRLGIQRSSRVGEILMEMGHVTASQLGRSLAKQEGAGASNRKRIGEIMIESGLITEQEMHSALEVQEFRKKYHRST